MQDAKPRGEKSKICINVYFWFIQKRTDGPHIVEMENTNEFIDIYD